MKVQISGYTNQQSVTFCPLLHGRLILEIWYCPEVDTIHLKIVFIKNMYIADRQNQCPNIWSLHQNSLLGSLIYPFWLV